MAKRSRQNRKKSIQARERSSRIMRTPVSSLGDNHAIVRDFMDKFEKASPEDAAALAMQLQSFIEGPNAMLNDPNQEHRRNKFLQEREPMAKAEAAFNRDNEGFINDVFDLSKAPLTARQKEECIAQGVHDFTTAQQNAMGKKAFKDLKIADRLANDRQVDVNFTGTLESVRVGGSSQQRVRSDIVGVGRRQFVFAPGVHKVPLIIKEAYDLMCRSTAEREERSQALKLSRARSQLQVAQDFRNIDQKFGSVSAALAAISEV